MRDQIGDRLARCNWCHVTFILVALAAILYGLFCVSVRMDRLQAAIETLAALEARNSTAAPPCNPAKREAN